MTKKKIKIVEKTRRKNGEGSIYQEKNGLWVGSIWIEQPDGSKKRKKVTAHSQMEVSKKLVELTGRMNALKDTMYSGKTFGELMQDWMLIFKKASVTPRTFEGNMRNFNLHIKPYLGNMKIEDVTKPVIQQVINELMAKGLANNTVKKNKFLLNQFFDYAMECGLVQVNPTYKIKVRNREVKLSDKENEYKAIPPEMRIKFLQAINSHPFLKPLCMTSMFAGLRVGELLALRWENIDFENKTIQVKNGITQVPQFDNKENVVYEGKISKDMVGQKIQSFDVCLYPFKNGKLLSRLNSKTIKREIHRLKKFCELLKCNEISIVDLMQHCNIWISCSAHKANKKQIQKISNMLHYYVNSMRG